MAKPSVVVHIAGQRYVIRSEADEDYILELARHVDEQIRELQSTPRPSATQNQVILAALNITDELFQHRQGLASLKAEVTERSQAAMALIDEEVGKLTG